MHNIIFIIPKKSKLILRYCYLVVSSYNSRVYGGAQVLLFNSQLVVSHAVIRS